MALNCGNSLGGFLLAQFFTITLRQDPLEVKALSGEARASDNPASLIDEVHQRLVDATWADRADLRESLSEMRQGKGVVRVPKHVA